MTRLQQTVTSNLAQNQGLLNNMKAINATNKSMRQQEYAAMHAHKTNFIGASLDHFDFNVED